MGGKGVTQVMKADARQLRIFEDRVQFLVCRCRIHRQVGVARIVEYPLIQRVFLAFGKQCGKRRRQDNCPFARARFGFADLNFAVCDGGKRPFHPQSAVFKVDVAPFQPADFAAPQSRHTFRVEKIPPIGVGFDHAEKFLKLTVVQHLFVGIIWLRHCCAVRGIAHDEPFFYCRVERFVKHHVDAANHAVGKRFALDWVFANAPLLFELVVKFLNIRRCQRCQRLFAEIWLDIVVHYHAVALHGALPQCENHIFVQPLVKPFPERHAAVLAEIDIAVGFNCAVQFVERFFLRFAKHRFVHRCSVVFVTDHNARFPASVRTLAHHAVTLRSSFCHCFSSFRKFFCPLQRYHRFE